MAGNWGDQISVSTSIALLQERFTLLQKIKEKREGKEHQRLMIYSEKGHIMPATPFEHSNMNFQKDQTLLSRTPQQESSPMSLGLELYKKHANLESMRSAEKRTRRPSYNYGKWDVDTSLHL